MAYWRDEYCAALAIRDETEKANVVLYDAYTRLADRTSRISTVGSTQRAPSTTVSSPGGGGGGRIPKKNTSDEPATPSLADLLAATRSDLSEAQRSRAELQDRLARTTTELEKIRKKNVQDTRRITLLEGERTHLTLRLKDRDEELRGKAKLLEDFQDEMATLNLQLNMAEEQSNRLKKENKELIDRWMARMGKEADAMNDASQF